MKSVFKMVAIIWSVLGFVSGIILGVSTHSFLFTLIEWVATFLFALIYYGIYEILNNQDYIFDAIRELKINEKKIPTKQESVFSSSNVKKPNIPSQAGWTCPDCGRINQEFMENCFDCGKKKP